MFIFGIGSGAAMIPYSIIKEVNPDNVKGSATGGINFLVFALTAFLGPIFASHVGRDFRDDGRFEPTFSEGRDFLDCVLCGSDCGEFLSSRDGKRRAPSTRSKVDTDFSGLLRAFPPRN